MIRREELLKEELERLSGIGDIISESPSTLKLIDANTLVIVSSEQLRGSTPNQVVNEYDITEFDHVLVVLEDIILDIASTPVLVYTSEALLKPSVGDWLQKSC